LERPDQTVGVQEAMITRHGFYDELKKRGLPASELLQIALGAELERQDALDETARYLGELVAEVGEPSTRQQSQADAIARRIRGRSLDRVS